MRAILTAYRQYGLIINVRGNVANEADSGALKVACDVVVILILP